MQCLFFPAALDRCTNNCIPASLYSALAVYTAFYCFQDTFLDKNLQYKPAHFCASLLNVCKYISLLVYTISKNTTMNKIMTCLTYFVLHCPLMCVLVVAGVMLDEEVEVEVWPRCHLVVE